MNPVSLRPRNPMAFVMFSAALAVFLAAVPVVEAGPWQGTVETQDGVEVVHNPMEPMEAPAVIQLQEQWRIGGDSEEEGEFFGVIAQIATDSQGNVYLLDTQLSEVKVFSPGGAYLRTIGREGEGPGEFRNALDMFMLPDGNVGVLQLAPGRIVKLSPEGDPMGDYPLPDTEGGASATLVGGRGMGDNLVLVFSENTPHEGRVDIKRYLALIGPDGKEKARLVESTRVLEFVNFLFDETVWRTFDNRWDVSPAGNLYAAVTYQDYAVTMWDAAGTKKRVITREYDRPKRTQEQKDEMYDIFDSLLQNQLPQYSIKVSEYDPDITNVFPQTDGSLWVLNSRGTRNRPDGAMGVFDVFDSQGHYVRRVTLMGEGTPMKDGYFFKGDRIFVVTDLLEANIASRGGHKGQEEDAEEAKPIEVICYTLGDATAQAK